MVSKVGDFPWQFPSSFPTENGAGSLTSASRPQPPPQRRDGAVCGVVERLVLLAETPEVEPNDTLAQATVLPFVEDPVGSGFFSSNTALGVIDPAGDNDYWSFDAKAGDRLAFELDRTSGGNGQRVIISDAAGGTIFDTTSGGYSWFGSPPKTTPPPVTIPADGTYYARVLNWPGYSGVWTYQLRVDLGRAVQLEPYDWNFYTKTSTTPATSHWSCRRAHPDTWSRRWPARCTRRTAWTISRWADSIRATGSRSTAA